MSIKRSLVASLAAGGITLAAFGLPALAQDSGGEDTGSGEVTEERTAEDRAAARAEKEAEKEAERAARAQEFADRLGEKLGVPGDDVAAAVKELKAEIQAEKQERLQAMLDEKLASGQITQEQYDAAQARIAEGKGFGFGRGKGHGHGPRKGFDHPKFGQDLPAADAEASSV